VGRTCKQIDVIDNDEQGYFLRDWIVVEIYDEVGTLTGRSSVKAEPGEVSAKPALRLCEKQRWVLARLAAEAKVTRREVEAEFGISIRTAKRVLGELSDAGLIEFDRTEHPGYYRLS
jgi:predicted HTH transcriptional regulator